MSAAARIPLSRPSVGEEEVEAAARAIRSGWLSQGEEVAALEREFGLYLDPTDPPHVVAASSCTAALHLCLVNYAALRCPDPDLVVACPSYTFVATANAAIHARAEVRLREIDAATYNLDPARLRVAAAEFKRPVNAVIAVHQVGMPCDLAGIWEALPRAAVIEDAACAIGARAGGRHVGTDPRSVAACFSLHGSKSVVAGEGGLVATRDRGFAARLRSLRQHGVDVGAEHRPDAATEQYGAPGWNYRMTDVQAAIAREQVRKADRIVTARRRLADRYNHALGDICAVPVVARAGVEHAYQRYLIRVVNGETRERLVEALLGAGISCRRGLQVVHRQPYWRGRDSLPVTEAVADTTVQLPLWADMAEDEQERVIAGVRHCLEAGER